MEAMTSITGRIDTPMAAGILVIAALAALFALNKLSISIN